MTLRALLIALLCLTLPLWLLAGFGDWLCHRRSQIHRTAGPREPLFHLALHLLIAVPVVLAMYFELNATMLSFAGFCVLAHMAVSLADTSFAQPRRHISPVEQQIHSYLEMLPLFALALTAVLHWDAVRAPSWPLTVRREPLPEAWTWSVMLGLLAGMAMIVEEWVRCLRAMRDLPVR